MHLKVSLYNWKGFETHINKNNCSVIPDESIPFDMGMYELFFFICHWGDSIERSHYDCFVITKRYGEKYLAHCNDEHESVKDFPTASSIK